MKGYFATLARYNVWATHRLYGHIDALPEADYRRDAGLFFRSVHGTLNHLLVAQQVLWYFRFAEGVSNRRALNEELETDRVRLRERLFGAVAQWVGLVDRTEPSRFDGVLHYTSTRGVPQSLPFAPTLGHVFNHGTHHRGQITAAITAMGHPCPEIDLIWMLQAEART